MLLLLSSMRLLLHVHSGAVTRQQNCMFLEEPGGSLLGTCMAVVSEQTAMQLVES